MLPIPWLDHRHEREATIEAQNANLRPPELDGKCSIDGVGAQICVSMNEDRSLGLKCHFA